MENLKALVFGRQLTAYQRALAQREFKDMVELIELLEKAVKNNAVLPLVSNNEVAVCQTKNTHNLDILHLGACTKCGGTSFRQTDC